ncbi:MAG: alanine dehydrogenase [Chloroflexi bacterium]|nr:alanine dehydrogenase [Chloroflexota bacterium]|tara:strand:+ start:12955 stop:14082 length:1128 start_codon:yes stop_codon:yes gene_type:complete
MIIGIPKETKNNENRIALTPDKVEILTQANHKVLIEENAGINSGFTNEEYNNAGASILPNPKEIYLNSNLIVKVKEPQPSEYEYLNKKTIMFCYLHLASNIELTKQLIKKNVTSIAYETIVNPNGKLNLLYPMSEIAGKMAALNAAQLLTNKSGGQGKLLSGVVGTLKAKILIIGCGTVGTNAALLANNMGADVTVSDINLTALSKIQELSNGQIKTIYSSPSNIKEIIVSSDVVIGAVLIPGYKAPKVVTSDMINKMKKNSVIIDVAIDQGGCVEGIKPTTHENPTYSSDGIIYYAVTNIPGIVGNTASISLSNNTFPYIRDIAKLGLNKLLNNKSFINSNGINTYAGFITNREVALSLNKNYTDINNLLENNN